MAGLAEAQTQPLAETMAGKQTKSTMTNNNNNDDDRVLLGRM